MPLSDPIGTAAARAGELGACPVGLLDDFYTNHWDFPTLCSGFSCPECVATDEDLGLAGPWDARGEEVGPASWDIPF